MISVIFSGKIVMAMHIVTVEIDGNDFVISLSNGLVLKESFADDEQKAKIASKFAFLEARPQ